MSLTILGLGTAQPPFSIAQERAAELTSRLAGHSDDQARRLSALYRRSGISKRHIALLDRPGSIDEDSQPHDRTTRWRMRRYDAEVRPLAERAARLALESAGRRPSAITHLVTVSCTGFSAPGFDIALMKQLGLRPTVRRTHVGFMGCHGALNGLRVAQAFADSDPEAAVLLCAAELCSLHFRHGDDADLAVANALFADGAAALVGARAPSDEPEDWRVVDTGSFLIPETEAAMAWQVGDHGFEMTLSPRVSGLIGEHLRPWLSAWLARSGLSPSEVASWAVHPGGPRVLDGVEEALGLPRSATEDSRAVLDACGNMSSPTILFILDRLRRRGAPRPCVALAFGPGLVIEAALFR